MPFGTDMGGFPDSGMVPRINPINQSIVNYPGLSFRRLRLIPPKRDDFTQVNTFASITDKSDRLVVTVDSRAAGVAGAVRLLTRPVPLAPYTIDFAGMVSAAINTSAQSTQIGVVAYDGTKLETFHLEVVGTSAFKIQIQTWNSTTTFGTTVLTTYQVGSGMIFLRVTDDGVNRTYLYSSNGKDFNTILTRTTTTFLTATQIGMMFYGVTSGAINSLHAVYHWDVYPGTGIVHP
jgi:hypothetical protein